MVVKVKSKQAEHLAEAFTRMTNAYKSYGWTVRVIRTDREASFRAIESTLNGIGIQCEYTGRGLHERRAERAIRIIKERVRILRCTQVYKLPARLNEAAVMDIVATLNMTPNKRSGVQSPREVITGKKVNAPRDIRIEFGKLVPVKVPNQPSSEEAEEPRVEDGIVVGRDHNSNGSLRIFLLENARIVSRSTFKPCNFTPTVCTRLNELADHDQSPRSRDPVIPYKEHPNPPDWSRSQPNPSDDPTPAEPPAPEPEDVSGKASDSDPAISSQPQNDTEPVSEEPTESDSYAFNISVKEAIRLHSTQAESAIVQEMDQLFKDKSVLAPILRANPQGRKHIKVLPSSMFLKEKRSARTNEFEKLKARLVGGGHMTDRSLYTSHDTSSPTVKTESLMVVLCIAAFERRSITTMDVPGAYLNASLEHPHTVRIPRDVTEVYVRHRPELSRFVQPNGTILADVTKALYGLPEAGLCWYRHIAGVLTNAGYLATEADVCIFHKSDKKGGRCIIALHVDDLLVASTASSLTQDLERILNQNYGKVKTQSGSHVTYLGMLIATNPDGSIGLSMPAYIDELLRLHSDRSKANTPATKHLFRCDQPGNPVDYHDFLSLLMKQMYLAKRTRPDILLACSHLATRSLEANSHDDCKLRRIVGYLASTKALHIVLSPKKLELQCWADASYGVHPDGKGHTGLIFTMGPTDGLIFAKSVKQKCVSRSSSEAELIAADTGVPYAMNLRGLITELGYPQPPTIFHQDIQSSIWLSEHGTSKSGRTQHIRVRYHFLQERVQAKDIQIRYKPTEDMLADILTKPLGGQSFLRIRDLLLHPMCSPETEA